MESRKCRDSLYRGDFGDLAISPIALGDVAPDFIHNAPDVKSHRAMSPPTFFVEYEVAPDVKSHRAMSPPTFLVEFDIAPTSPIAYTTTGGDFFTTPRHRLSPR
jgi:hypothetical protein